MLNTTITVKRSGSVMRTGLAVNVQNMGWQTAVEMGARSPYDAFWVYSTGGGTLDIRRGDLLIDEHNVDPLTNASVQYRVFGRPQMYFQAYISIPAEEIIGT